MIGGSAGASCVGEQGLRRNGEKTELAAGREGPETRSPGRTHTHLQLCLFDTVKVDHYPLDVLPLFSVLFSEKV